MIACVTGYATMIGHYVVHVVSIATAAVYWWKHSVLKDVIEDKLERRHTMINPVTILQDVNLAVTAVEKLKAALPAVVKLVADIKQARADQSDPVKLEADLVTILGEMDSDLKVISDLFPASAPAAPAVGS